ncbi:unnamed protein product [Dracunculus medinensis]|uniref:WD_REPEATS_REGION domain-containing protein n=1 Tax=Dracunculus medinensis TaxID=318479 RepID=A0A0N4UQE2_DRAME|nr:unnamed protein product [Dracunculus medinensis]
MEFLGDRNTGEARLEPSTCLDGIHSRAIRHVDFSPSGRYLSSASFDSVVIIYELVNNDYQEFTKIEGHENEVKCCAFSSCGQYLATCSRDKTVWCWQIDEEEEFEIAAIFQNHSQDVKFVTWHPHEELILSCSYDCSIHFYQFDSDEWILQQKIEAAHDDTVWAADFSEDGEMLVTVGADHAVKLWTRQKTSWSGESYKWSKAAVLLVDTRWPLYSVSWNKITKLIAVGGGDGHLRFFEIQRCADILALIQLAQEEIFPIDINCITWNPVESNLLAVGLDDGTVRLILL